MKIKLMKIIIIIISTLFCLPISAQKYTSDPLTRSALNVEYAGLKGDWLNLDSLSINIGSNTVTYSGSSAAFDTLDIGKIMIVWGAGRLDADSTTWNGDEHISIITAVPNDSQVIVADTAFVTVTLNKAGS